MELSEIASMILFGQRLKDKLVAISAFEDSQNGPPLLTPPAFPGRPVELGRIGRSDFPEVAELADPLARGRLLHFFANHELLALELMALVLLKFPDAPRDFRKGIARTMAEEQDHLRLYLDRMRELGVSFGELPVSDYFWNAMKDVTSPLQFVTQMSLTLEQANLDYSKFYQLAVDRAGDPVTAALLERVYREEIGHVKHGVAWFNRWFDPEKYADDWDAFLGLLPEPMSPRRAKGPVYFEEPRRIAGLSERFIRELEVFAGSKGRPPVFWAFNPLCDSEIARGKPGFTPRASVRALGEDLQTLPMFFAKESDVVLVSDLPSTAWLKEIKDLGFNLPEFRVKDERAFKEPRIGGFQPWGWSPDTFNAFRGMEDRIVRLAGANGLWCRALLGKPSFQQTGLAPLFSKSWSTRYLKNWLSENPIAQETFGTVLQVGGIYTDWEAARNAALGALKDGIQLLAKAPYATSGAGNRRILKSAELEDGVSLSGWIRNTIELQGEIVLEPLLPKHADLSLQMEVGPEIRLKGIRHFTTGPQFDYRGTHLDSKLRSLSAEILRFLMGDSGVLKRWEEFALQLGEKLFQSGYQGPAGIDGLIYQQGTELKLKPLVELNPRWTLGRLALELEAHVLPGTPALFMLVSLRKLPQTVSELKTRFPVQCIEKRNQIRVAEGVLFVTDPARAKEAVALLAVGRCAAYFLADG